MTKKIFQSILLVAGCVLLASLLIIVGFLYDYFGGVEENQLRDELSLAAAAVEDGGTDYLSQLTADRYRLTWIAADGSVLYDTKTNAESLVLHLRSIRSRSSSVYGFRIFFSTFIDSTSTIGFLRIRSRSRSHPKKLLYTARTFFSVWFATLRIIL